mgnify:CR=1 FL=1
MASEMHVPVREMLLGEKADVEAFFIRSLGPIDRIVFLLSFEDALKSAQKQNGSTLVATYGGKIVGSVSMRIQLIRGKRTGFIDALVTDKELRGRGIGRSLMDGAVSWLEEQKCEVVYATADRYNSPSWNMFVHRGFRAYEFPQQLRDYGWSFLRLWLGEFYFIGFGTFFLRKGPREAEPREASEVWSFVAAWLCVSLTWLIQAFRAGQPLVFLPLSLAVTGLSLFAHEFSQKVVGRLLSLDTTFKVWESGVLFSSLLAVIGSFFPSHGSIYVKQLDY